LSDILRFDPLHTQIDALFDFSANPQQRIRTGLDTIDSICGGPAPGEIYMILGRSFSGKSLVAQNIIHYNKGLPSIFFSLEMPYIQALQRMYAIWSDTPGRDVQEMTEHGTLPDHVKYMADDFPEHRIVDTEALTLYMMSKYIEKFDKEYGAPPAFVVIDYLELVNGSKKAGEGWVGVDSIATSLKDWAKSIDMPVFVLHQCNLSENAWDPPTPNSPRGGGFTEADFVVGMWQEGRDPKLSSVEMVLKKNKINFNVLKNRAYGDTSYSRDIQFLIQPSLRLESME
jgi:replicative DNA helicase